MKIKNLLLFLFICTTALNYAQTSPQETDQNATLLMSDAPSQEIPSMNGTQIRVRKVAELLNVDFKNSTSLISDYPDGKNDKIKSH